MPLTSKERARVRQIRDWVLGLIPPERRPEELEIVEDHTPSGIVRGFAYSDYTVEILLPSSLTTAVYPRSYKYRKAAGAVSYPCWCCEVAQVIGHEARHVMQFREHKARRPKHFEVDAEAYSRCILDLFIARKRCRHAS